ncbi:hypothetical protein MF406_11015 [Georgenia sp. TF02-10]|uniref:antitoxin VbhA family protein n=1 Tax=Georgenia sp. TF02-10 TaxID=2917725 RepID=UPI001FA6E0B2|nr:hypothetical protein [Georgenia sp. TF02-10]UNX53524.1 hypothetical protein MF406_11015 [Georgenia sp. TF02-10]
MAAEFDIEGSWPELFAPLSDAERREVVSNFASSWHEGWVPNRTDVEDLIAWKRGVIDDAEYDRRTEAAIARGRAQAIAG